MASYHNPYSDLTFFEFFHQFVIRIFLFIRGDLSTADIASDEVQVCVLIGVAASSALVGSFLVLRKMTMLANSLSHTILLGIVIAYFLSTKLSTNPPGVLDISSMLLASFIVALMTAFLTEFLTKVVKLQEDASTGLVFTTLFALGIIFVTLLTRNVHIGLEAVMGNVDALQIGDLKIVFIIFVMNLALFLMFFKEFKITTFDPALAKAFGLSTMFFNYLLMTQASATIIGAFRAVGVLMVLAFITGPSLTARFLTHDLKKMLMLAVFLGGMAGFIGVALSRHILTVYGMALSTAGIVVCVISAMFIMTVIFKKIESYLVSNVIQK